MFGLLPRVSGTEMRGFQETDKSPHVRQPCAAEVNEYWNEITLGPFCSHLLSKLVFEREMCFANLREPFAARARLNLTEYDPFFIFKPK